MNPHDPDSLESKPDRRMPESLRAKVDRYILSCSAIAGTGLGMFAMAEPARADFVFTESTTFNPGAVTFFGKYVIPTTLNFNGKTGTYINLQNGKGYTFGSFTSNPNLLVRIYGPANSPVNSIQTYKGNYSSGPNTGKIYGKYLQVSGQLLQGGHLYFYQKGKSVPGTYAGAKPYAGHYNGINAALTAPGVKYVFIGFNIVAPTAPNYLGTGVYGFMELKYNAGKTYLVGWEYSLSAAAITTEIIPEPGTLGLTALAMGAAGIVAMRRKRAAAKKAAEEAAALPA